jgi:hypothetical protein
LTAFNAQALYFQPIAAAEEAQSTAAPTSLPGNLPRLRGSRLKILLFLFSL